MSKQKKRKYHRKKGRQKLSLSFWLVIILMIGIVFVYTITSLSEDDTPAAQETADVSKEEFIAALAPHAKELQAAHGILPSIIISQAILESDWGTSDLGKKYYNLFGMKAYGDTEKVHLTTKEYVDGKWVEVTADFKVYTDWGASMDDHTNLFVTGVSWNPSLYEKVLSSTDYKTAAQALQDAGYATDPGYAEKLVTLVEEYHLDQYD